MKKTVYILLITAISLTILATGCYQNTIDALSTFKFQLAVLFDSKYYNKAAPDTTVDFTNLDKYKQYRDNKKRIKKAEFLEFNYWIDSLHLDNGKPFDPITDKDKVQFDFIRFYLVFAQPKSSPVNGDPLDSVNYQFIPGAAWHLLGEFKNVNVSDYYREAKHILMVPEAVANVISEAVKTNSTFYIVSEYSKVTGQTEPKRKFPFIWARFDVVIRFEYEL